MTKKKKKTDTERVKNELAKNLPSIKVVKQNQDRVGGIVISVEQCGVKTKLLKVKIREQSRKKAERSREEDTSDAIS